MVYQEIDRYLKNKGITQAYIARNTGLSESAVSMALSGKRDIEVEEYIRICAALNVPVSMFISKAARQ
jgi:transcriptional regulator with XRE-family HTH domain